MLAHLQGGPEAGGKPVGPEKAIGGMGEEGESHYLDVTLYSTSNLLCQETKPMKPNKQFLSFKSKFIYL